MLRADARAKRDETIQVARAECRRTLAQLRSIAKRLDEPVRRNEPYQGGLSSTVYAEQILAEQGPLTLLELAVEAQRRGYRPDDTPKRVLHAFRTSMRYHTGRFCKIGERWGVAI